MLRDKFVYGLTSIKLDFLKYLIRFLIMPHVKKNISSVKPSSEQPEKKQNPVITCHDTKNGFSPKNSPPRPPM